MTVTAARLGQAPITLDWSCLANVSPKGTPARTTPPAEAWEKLRARFQNDEAGFYNAPIEDRLSQLEATQELARSIRSSGKFRDVLLLGIGGSALGPLALLSALHEKQDGHLRFHFLQNVDPQEWSSTLDRLNPAQTLVLCVTKSGTTFETLAQFQCALEWLGKDRWSGHVVAITDPAKGDLLQFARNEAVPVLTIAPSIGGRFSVFTPVGLFPAALAGLDITAFLEGAKQVRDYCEKQVPEKNLLLSVGKELIRHFEDHPIHVCMPYSTRLQLLGDWFVQLWGESLGKDGKGFTPLGALGATDQHSILQLLRDGPDDKVTTFITVDKVPNAVSIPSALRGTRSDRLPAFRILEGHTLQGLLMTEYRATALVLSRRNRPHWSLHLDQLDERNLGALMFAYSVLTAATGTQWQVDPFDQPGVEEAKVYIREALNRETQERAQVEDENSPVNRLRRDH